MNSSSCPTSFLVLFFIVSLFHQLPCALSKQGLGWCKTLFQCGNITAGYPFWGGNRPKPCGHPLLEFHCNKNTTSLIISNQEYHVLQVAPYTLRLARADLLGPFCSAKFTAPTFFPEIFEPSYGTYNYTSRLAKQTYKSLTVYYFCDPRLNYLLSFTCPNWGIVSISQNPDYQYSCQNSFTVNVPTSFVPKENNLTHLETVLREGFELNVPTDIHACERCLSSQGSCGFDGTKQVCCRETLASGVQCRLRDLDDEIFTRCSTPFSCGNLDSLSYPFWVPGREECGHPDFKVNCSRGFPEFIIASMKFTILEKDYFRTRIARSDYISNICTLDPLAVPFNGSVLPLSPDTELLTLYYDCTERLRVAVAHVGELGCVNHAYSYFMTKNITSLWFTRPVNNCGRNVTIPASGPALITLQRDPTLPNLRKALEQGFVIGRGPDCLPCSESGGVCGSSKISNRFVCYCRNGTQSNTCGGPLLQIITRGGFSGAEIGSVTCVILFALLVALIPLYQRLREKKTAEKRRQKKLMAHIPLKHFSFAEAKKITNSFAEVVGEGGFGTVYKGTLSDGRMVAVKVLKDSKGNGEDFINEVASMSKTSHVNIVSLLGFCFEGSKRAIIYEFVGNGSLGKYISSKRSMNTTDWKELYGIALGVARGLEYLHHGCKTRIVHFDIKPHNVLLDDNLCPKVSDFGLARLCEKKESILSSVDTRGTVGYIAPEMIYRANGNVSYKSDVYSYGMLVLEMIGARNKEIADQEYGSNISSMYFPDWVYKDLERGRYGNLIEDGISSEEEEIARKMTLVGLWCIQSSPSDRPPMNRVVEMMEGNADALEVPPNKPVLQQIIQAAPLPESSWLLKESSSYSDTSEVIVCSTN